MTANDQWFADREADRLSETEEQEHARESEEREWDLRTLQHPAGELFSPGVWQAYVKRGEAYGHGEGPTEIEAIRNAAANLPSPPRVAPEARRSTVSSVGGSGLSEAAEQPSPATEPNPPNAPSNQES